ncbi:hypothetical protein BH24CHL3_BH24CHL3_00280 [soil metagenome]
MESGTAMSKQLASNLPRVAFSPSISAVDSLPRPITSFVGRESDVTSVASLLADASNQLVTIVGPGGIGKTRLAIDAARWSAPSFAHGIVFADLAPKRDARLVPATIGKALGIDEGPGQSLIDRFPAATGGERLLIVVDNLEHVLDSAIWLAKLLERRPSITLLCTSRTRLDVAGEHVVRILPLDRESAIELFGQRARKIDGTFDCSGKNATTVASICNRLDGLPLAIELAAVRVSVSTPQSLLELLDRRLVALSGGRRDAPDRHRGIREAIAWSYDLLSETDRQVFQCLSVFDGGFTLEAAGLVCGDCDRVTAGVFSLEANSLVQTAPGWQGEPRFAMLETVREFALERLRESGEDEATRHAHAEYFADIGVGTEQTWWQSIGTDKLDQIESELPNIRTALGWLKEVDDVEAVLRFAGSLGPMWASRGYSLEGQELLEWGLCGADVMPPHVTIVALRSLSWIVNQHGDYYRAHILANHAYMLSQSTGDKLNLVATLQLCGTAAFRSGLTDLATSYHTLALEHLTAGGEESWTHIATCIASNRLGLLALHKGEIDQAEQWYTRSLSNQRQRKFRFGHGSHATMGLGDVARARGQNAQALRHYQEAMRSGSDAHDVRGNAYLLGAIGGALAAMGDYETAGRLFGASEAYHQRIMFPFVPVSFDRLRAFGLPEPWAGKGTPHGIAEPLFLALERQTEAIRSSSIDRDLANTWWNEGRGLSLGEATTIALDALARDPGGRPRPGGLSTREVEVLSLMTQGHTDEQIASLLSISRRTASNHVHHIYTKLDLSSRAAATAWALRHGLS